jgi:hypothetical protein
VSCIEQGKWKVSLRFSSKSVFMWYMHSYYTTLSMHINVEKHLILLMRTSVMYVLRPVFLYWLGLIVSLTYRRKQQHHS